MAPFSIAPFSIALGEYPHTRGLIAGSPPTGLSPQFADIKPINRAFKPTVRELKFDVAELAIVTFLMAKAQGVPLVLLPIVTAARAQQGALLCRSDDTSIKGPEDLAGRVIGVRAYSQTTGVWLRGVLEEFHGVATKDIDWVTFEDAHVAGYQDPPWARRAEPDADLMAMLKDGSVDAVIVGADVPDDPGIRQVFADPEGSAKTFRDVHGFTPVNHMMVARQDRIEADPAFGPAVLDWFRTKGASLGTDVVGDLGAAIDLAVRYSDSQGLLPRPLSLDEVWAGWPGPRGLAS